MPRQELPEEYLRTAGSPTNSSLSSHSSDIVIINTNYQHNRTDRSESLSSCTTNTQNDEDSFEGHLILENNRSPDVNERVGPIYLPIKLPTEPTLDELLVCFNLLIYLFSCLNNFNFLQSETSVWQWRCANNITN